MNEECKTCKSNKECSTAVQYNSVMCMIKRMQSNQTKADILKESKGDNI